MKKLLFLMLLTVMPIAILFVMIRPAHAANRYFEITVAFNEDTVSRCDVNVLGGEPETPKGAYLSGQYYLELVPYSGTSSVQAFFDFVQPAVSINIPYESNIKEIMIYNTASQKNIYTKDIAYLSQVCGDTTCQPHESYETCPEDCSSGTQDDYCDQAKDGKCDPDCVDKSMDADCVNAPKAVNSNKRIILFAFIIIILGGMFAAWYFLIREKKREKKEDPLTGNRRDDTHLGGL